MNMAEQVSVEQEGIIFHCFFHFVPRLSLADLSELELHPVFF